MGRRERMDSHGPDLSLLFVYRGRLHGAVVYSAAEAWRLAKGPADPRGATERDHPADRLVHPSSALLQLLAYASAGSSAADRRGVSLRVCHHAGDGATRTDYVDRRTARRILCPASLHSRTRM